jgi:hypothetical protein
MRSRLVFSEIVSRLVRECVDCKKISQAESLRFRPNIEIQRAAEQSEFLQDTFSYYGEVNTTTYAFKDGSVLVVGAQGVLFNS